MTDKYVITNKLKYQLRKSSSRSLTVARSTNSSVTPAQVATLLSYPIEVARDAPLGQYRMGESGALTTATDSTDNEKHGTYGGNVTNAAGGLYLDSDTAKEFDGVNAYASFPTITLSTNATIEGIFLWYSGTDSLIRDATSGAGGWIMGYSSAGFLAFRVAGTSYVTTTTVASIQNAWKHIVLVKTGPLVDLYVDNTVVHSGVGASNTASQTTWYAMKNGSSASFIYGRADEIAFYDSALSAARVEAHYNAFKGIEGDPG